MIKSCDKYSIFLEKVNPKYAIITCEKDNEYGSLLEINTFSKIFQIKITIYIRHIDDEKLLKKDSDILRNQNYWRKIRR